MKHTGLKAVAAALLAAAGMEAAWAAGTVIVDYQVQAEITGRDQTGRDWRAANEEVLVLPRDPKALTPYSAVQYSSPALQWTFGTGTLGFGGTILNKGASELCLRFDAARISSNVHPEEVPLVVYHDARRTLPDKAKAGDRGKLVSRGTTVPGPRPAFSPNPLCLGPGEQVWVTMGPNLTSIFPTQKMFNVRLENDRLADTGVGNWIKVTVPVEQGEKRETLTVKLTATDSRARVSNY